MDVAWTYEEPLRDALRVRDLVGFYNGAGRRRCRRPSTGGATARLRPVGGGRPLPPPTGTDQPTQPGTVFTGAQLPGLFFRTIDCRRVTLPPAATKIPPPGGTDLL
ncbi:MAG: hypothetical protein ACRDS0_30020, partial [Pseudonocardiaceae bacterium]